ncbi:MAG: hypothetical protein AABX01_02900 [Candidatus Micrarchaeota archaeon]
MVGLKRKKILSKRLTPVEQKLLDKFRRIADEKGITDQKLIEICREVGRQVYQEEYG